MVQMAKAFLRLKRRSVPSSLLCTFQPHFREEQRDESEPMPTLEGFGQSLVVACESAEAPTLRSSWRKVIPRTGAERVVDGLDEPILPLAETP
jgi:hypothetical protein